MDARAKALLKAWPSATPALKKSIAARLVEFKERTLTDEDDHFYGAWNAGRGGRGGPRTSTQARALGRSSHGGIPPGGKARPEVKLPVGAWDDPKTSHGLAKVDKKWDDREWHLERKIGHEGIADKLQKAHKPPPGAPTELDPAKLKGLKGGISSTWTYTENGKKWVVKNSEAGSLSSTGVRNELATAVVNEGMGDFMTMPKIYATKANGDVVSVSEFIDGAAVARTGKYTPNVSSRADLDVLDYVVANGDRHRGNYMVRPDGQVVAIDHDITFLTHTIIRPDTITPNAIDAIHQLQLNRSSVDRQLRSLGVKKSVRDGVFERANELLYDAPAGIPQEHGIATSDFLRMAQFQNAFDDQSIG